MTCGIGHYQSLWEILEAGVSHKCLSYLLRKDCMQERHICDGKVSCGNDTRDAHRGKRGGSFDVQALIKLEFENQSASLLHTSHTIFHHRIKSISCELQTSVVLLAKKKNSFSTNTQRVAVIYFFATLRPENWNLITAKSASCSLSLVKWTILYFASCSIILNNSMVLLLQLHTASPPLINNRL